ncbi:hypothetical protein Pint_12819 [Pistacia integerrima]|uniref:Uncharacterized protein n=1 Tax=Pistacia integerrima TaxID=434235 RepID=A0ACC0Y693_9ROSI|nr:hypothetical protein Pint_12819 [Pistacia integerrima]
MVCVVSIPEQRQNFCFRYTVENPAFNTKLSALELGQYGPRFTGVGAQILGADDKYICQYSQESSNFWASRHDLILGNTFTAEKDSQPPNKEVLPQIGVHCDGIFYEFVPWNGVANWEIAPWGYWYMAAENETHMVELKATTTDAGTPIRAPTAEAGFATVCKGSCSGQLRLQIWERRSDGTKGKVILDVTSGMAAVDVGGGPWFNTWKGKTASPEILNCALNLPVDVDGFFSLIPFFKPPGL